MSANPAELFQQPLRRRLAHAAGMLFPRAQVRVCRHREWSKFGVYDEWTFCRLTDDLC